MLKPTSNDLKVSVQLSRPIIGTKINDINDLTPGGYDRVVIETNDTLKLPDEFYVVRAGGVNIIDPNTGEIKSNTLATCSILRKPLSYVRYVEELLIDLVEYPDEEISIDTFGKPESERSGIHHVAENLNLKITCNFDRRTNEFKVKKAINKRSKTQFSWWSFINDKEFTEVGYTGTFTSFRAKVYRVAKGKNMAVTIIKPDKPHCALVKIKSATREKSIQARFNEFLDSIPVGGTSSLPSEFKDAKMAHLRVLMSNHENQYSFIRGTITHINPAPRVDSNGDFILNGKNWGKRGQRFIELKLRNTDYTFEDVKHD